MKEKERGENFHSHTIVQYQKPSVFKKLNRAMTFCLSSVPGLSLQPLFHQTEDAFISAYLSTSLEVKYPSLKSVIIFRL